MSRVGPKHNHMYLYQRETEKVQRRKRKEDKRTMGSEIGMMQPQAQECWQAPENERGKEWILQNPQSCWGKCDLADTLILVQ